MEITDLLFFFLPKKQYLISKTVRIVHCTSCKILFICMRQWKSFIGTKTVCIICTYINIARLCCNNFFSPCLALSLPQCRLQREALVFVVLLFLQCVKKQEVWLSGEKKEKNNRIPCPHPPPSLSPPPPAWFVLNEGISACIPCVPDNAPSSLGPERVLSLCLCPLINCFIQGSAC